MSPHVGSHAWAKIVVTPKKSEVTTTNPKRIQGVNFIGLRIVPNCASCARNFGRAFLIFPNLLHFRGMKRAILPLFVLIFAVFATILFPKLSGDIVYAAISPVGVSACGFIKGAEHGLCQSCFDTGGAWTAIGCLGGDSPSDFISSFIKIGTGIGGGIAFLLILFSGFQTMMSAGNPEKLHEAKELMSAAISGLLLIVFSVFLLRLIGVDILGGLTGFSNGGTP